jgi:predicted transposase YbfD/YdcC
MRGITDSCAVGNFVEYRTGLNITHPFLAMAVSVFTAMVCGANSVAGIARFVAMTFPTVGRAVGMKSPPSRCTIGRLLAGCRGWEKAGRINLHVDGKALCGSRVDGKQMWVVEAWDGEQLIGMETCGPGEERSAVAKLLQSLDLAGHVITLDAGLNDRPILAAAADGGGTYVAQVKANKPSIYNDVQAAFADAADGHATVELGHGRVETRAAAVMDDPVLIAWLRETHDLPGLAAVGRIRRERITKNTGEIEQHDAFHLLGGAMAAADYAAAARGHWLVEVMHHCLDAVIGEDAGRSRNRQICAELAVLRRFGMTARRAICSEHSHAAALDFCRFNPAQTLRRLFPWALVPRPRHPPTAAALFGIRLRRRKSVVI